MPILPRQRLAQQSIGFFFGPPTDTESIGEGSTRRRQLVQIIQCCDSPEGRCPQTFWPGSYRATEGSRRSSDGASLHAGKKTGLQVEACVGDCEERQQRRKAPAMAFGVVTEPAQRHTLPAPYEHHGQIVPPANGLGDDLPKTPPPSPPSICWLRTYLVRPE